MVRFVRFLTITGMIECGEPHTKLHSYLLHILQCTRPLVVVDAHAISHPLQNVPLCELHVSG